MSWALNDHRVPVEQIRGAILQQGVTMTELARRMKCSEGGVRWLLGAKNSRNHRNGHAYGPYHAQTIAYDRAVQLVRAAGLDPVDVGL